MIENIDLLDKDNRKDRAIRQHKAIRQSYYKR